MQPLIDRLDSEGHFAIVRLAKAWPDIVGETIARRTEIVSLKFHTAVVKVSGAMWIQELNLMKAQILERVSERIGDDAVRELRFVHGRLEPARATAEIADRAARPAQIDRAAGIQGSRAARGLRKPRRGLGPRLPMKTLFNATLTPNPRSAAQ